MAHFAKISEENIVLTVLTLNNEDCMDEEGNEVESIGQAYLEKHNMWPAHLWIQTSYHTVKNTHKTGGTPFRGNYAGIGREWDPVNQIFWEMRPYPSWVKDVTSASWKSPIGDAPALTPEQIADTTKGYFYKWNEDTQSWDSVIKIHTNTP
jgi:hypothetical protein|tara:strand:- start:1093 stop:1545 length:453 start_codon:yes stop_codon:yes gene_type:complete